MIALYMKNKQKIALNKEISNIIYTKAKQNIPKNTILHKS